MAKELIYSGRALNDFEILVDDDVADDEVEIDYFLPRNRHVVTVKVKARDLFPKLFTEDHQ